MELLHIDRTIGDPCPRESYVTTNAAAMEADPPSSRRMTGESVFLRGHRDPYRRSRNGAPARLSPGGWPVPAVAPEF